MHILFHEHFNKDCQMKLIKNKNLMITIKYEQFMVYDETKPI